MPESDDDKKTPTPPTPPTEPSSAESSLVWFFSILALNVASLIWLSVRSSSPSYIAVALDFFMHSAIGGGVVFFAFRAVLSYPFRFTDLLAIVLVLSLGMKATLDLLFQLSMLGMFSGELFTARQAGELVQACLLTSAVLLAGAAAGLRHCKLLKIDGTFWRAVTVVCGMVALPAAAGVATFPVLILRDVVMPQNSSRQTHVLALLWFGSIAASVVNTVDFMRTMRLKSVVDAREKLP